MIYRTLTNKEIINSEYLGEDVWNLLDKTFKIPENGFSFTIFEVTRDYIARPDLISKDVYDTDRYADILCKLNGISNPFELNEGMKILIPSSDNLSDFIGKFDGNNIEGRSQKSGNKPKATTKSNKKRKANEAVVGDTRFKVDPQVGIIIY